MKSLFKSAFVLLSVFFILILLISGGKAFGQNQTMKPGIYFPDGSMMEQYQKTYEIKDVPNPDKTTISQIDATKYWKLYKDSTRVEVLDVGTGLTLILYSKTEANALFDYNTVLIVMPLDMPREETKVPHE